MKDKSLCCPVFLDLEMSGRVSVDTSFDRWRASSIHVGNLPGQIPASKTQLMKFGLKLG